MGKRVDSASRLVPVSPSAVYRAFEDPKAMESWLAPGNMTAEMLHFDFREGGSYRMRLCYVNPEDGRGKTSQNADEVEVGFIRIVDGRRIEQAVRFMSNDPEFSGSMRLTWTFDPVAGGTLVGIQAEDVPRGIRREDHEAGMNSTLANLAAFLTHRDE